MKKYKVTLTQEERDELGSIGRKGNQKAQQVLYALILLACDEGAHQTERSTNEAISRVLKVSMKTIDRVKKRFVENGFEASMTRKPTTRAFSKKIDSDVEARLIALSCSPAPEGHARWTLKLLANKIVELNYVDSVSYETVRRALKKRTV